MMKDLCKNFRVICLFVLCIAFTNCIPEGIELPNIYSVTTSYATNITENGVTLKGKVEIGDAYTKAKCGIIYGTSSTLSSEGILMSTTSKDEYSIAILGLEANTTYYYRAYAVDAGKYRYGEVRSFTTNATISVTTGAATNITASGATLSGSIANAKQSLTCGIIYGTSSTLSSTSGSKKSTTSSGKFSVNVTGLSSSTTYYYCAYVIVDGEYRYGETKSFTTNAAISVTTGAATNVTASGATLSGSIANAKQSLTCGIIYGTSSTLSSTNGTMMSTTSSGKFSVNVTGLSSSTTYYYCAYVVVDGEYKYGDVLSFTTDFTAGDAIDLGLSVKWASWNVGATAPEEYGGYFAWGETGEKSDYYWSTYKWGNDSVITKYCTDNDWGTVDNKTILDPEDDVAHVKWGGSWRMPTLDEIMELIDNCSCSWTSQNGVNGNKFTGPNGNSIFLPAAGYRHGTEVYGRGSIGNYWSGTLGEGKGASGFAYGSGFGSGSSGCGYDYRFIGNTVRPVTEE